MPKSHSSSENNRKKSKKPCNCVKCNKIRESPKYICSKCNEKVGKPIEMKRDPQNIFITFVN